MLNVKNIDKFDITKLVPIQLNITSGQPDLTVRVVPSPNFLLRDFQPIDSSVITITVQNRLRFRPPSVSGSDANNVAVYIYLSSHLQQVGNMGLPAGFQAVVTPDHHTVFCFGGTIPAGGSVDMIIEVIEVVGENWVGDATIEAVVDPYNSITENLEENNIGSGIIWVTRIN